MWSLIQILCDLVSLTSIQIENDRLIKGVHSHFGCLLICFGISENLTIEHSNRHLLMLFSALKGHCQQRNKRFCRDISLHFRIFSLISEGLINIHETMIHMI